MGPRTHQAPSNRLRVVCARKDIAPFSLSPPLPGHIGYSLAPLIAKGAMLGPSTRVELNLLDVKQALGLLEGLRMELEDLASPLLQGRAAPQHCAGSVKTP